jgi:hypothetical protein
MNEIKKWYTSKTFWFNIITAILAILAMPEVLAIIPVEYLKYIAAIGVIGNIILRFKTIEAIGK